MKLNLRNFLCLLLATVAIGLIYKQAGASRAIASKSAITPLGENPAISDAVLSVTRAAEISSPITYIGVIVARSTTEIAAQSEGRLEMISANLGDRLRRGELIARIESASLQQQLEAARAALRIAEAERRAVEMDVAEAKSRFARRQALSDDGLISKEELEASRLQVEKAAAALDTARARIEQQQAQVRQYESLLGRTEIRAPFDGTVAARYGEIGATVHPGTPVLSLMRADDMLVRFAVPKSEAPSLKLHSSVAVTADLIELPLTAVVAHIAPGVEAVSQSITVEARLKGPAASLALIKPGQAAKVSLAPPAIETR